MASKRVYTVPFRRKRKVKTNYRRRLALLKSNLLRLVVRKSNKNITAQLVKFGEKGDVVLFSANSKQLLKYGWDTSCSNTSAAYLVGLLLGTQAKNKEAILDLGLQSPLSRSRVYAVAKGAADGGLKIKMSENVIPDMTRIQGKHIADYATKLKDDKSVYKKIFSNYLKMKKSPDKIQDYFEKSKEKILTGNKNGKRPRNR